MTVPFGLPRETIMDDELRDVQPLSGLYPIDLWPEPRPVVGRSSSASRSILNIGPYRWPWFFGGGGWRRSRWPYRTERNSRGSSWGSGLRQEDACRGDQMLYWIE